MIRRFHQRGVGLIEVMVAVLVLSIGFLALAVLEAQALSTNNSAMARSMATMASYSILDAMRADLSNAQGGAYNTASGGSIVANACPAAGSALASTQINQWCQQLGKTFGATASTKATITCSTSGDCTVAVTFDDSRAGAGGSKTQTVTTRAIL